jgi:outer membrane receptor protein involved in Fe transport
LQLNVNNLTDTDAIESTVGRDSVLRTWPRHYRVTFRYHF